MSIDRYKISKALNIQKNQQCCRILKRATDPFFTLKKENVFWNVVNLTEGNGKETFIEMQPI